VRGMRGEDQRRVSRARSLRRALTPAESELWSKLRNRQLGGFKFARQEPIGPYYVDFVCRERRLIVELDGGQHAESATDQERQRSRRARLSRNPHLEQRDRRKYRRSTSSPADGIAEIAPHPDPLPASGAREKLMAEHAVEGADGVVGAGFVFGFGLGEVGVEAGDRGVDVARRRVLLEEI